MNCFSEQCGKVAHDSCCNIDNNNVNDDEQPGRLQRCVLANGPIIVGAGPSGLATAACLREEGVPCLILEKADCIASLWQYRTYDRLKLHLPKEFCELPLMPFPADFPAYPNRAQFIEYLQSYSDRFGLHPRFNECVQSASYDPACGLWRVCASASSSNTGSGANRVEYICRWLIVATGENGEPVIPDILGMESFHGTLIHTRDFKTGAEYRGKNVLVVGCGNSGMEVCLDLSNHNARPSLVVRSTVHVLPREMFGRSTFCIAMKLMKWFPLWVVDLLLLVVANVMFGNTDRYGLRRPAAGPIELKNKAGKTPVLDVGALARIRSGHIKVLPAVERLTSRGAKFVNGEEMEFDSVVLATGYKSSVPSWLKECDFFSEDGMPKSAFPDGWKGENGLYAVGFTRRGLLGASTDAKLIAQDIAGQWKAGTGKHFILCRTGP